VADPANAPAWYANIESVELLTPPPLARGSRMRFRARFLGRRLDYTYEIVDLEPEVRVVMRTAEGPFPMETTYAFEAVGPERTRMRLRNRGEPRGFGRLAAPALAAAMRRANRADLARVAAILERPTGS
jgi:hypothetical protein